MLVAGAPCPVNMQVLTSHLEFYFYGASKGIKLLLDGFCLFALARSDAILQSGPWVQTFQRNILSSPSWLNPEDGGSRFLQNAGRYLPNYTTSNIPVPVLFRRIYINSIVTVCTGANRECTLIANECVRKVQQVPTDRQTDRGV